MDHREEVRAFLTSRRAKLAPENAGPAPRARRVPGLRRGEVADRAGVSVEYYAKIERGDLAGVSESVLHALADALQLDDAERAHLGELARPAERARRAPTPREVRPGIARVLEGMTALPALLHDGRLDVLAANPLARALYAPAFDGADPVNLARFDFLDPAARDFWPDWDGAADDAVAVLRTAAGREPDDAVLTDLVDELRTRSDAFRSRWDAHDVARHRAGEKRFHHPTVGEVTLSFEAMAPHADPGLDLVVFSAADVRGRAALARLAEGQAGQAGWAGRSGPADRAGPASSARAVSDGRAPRT